MAVMRGKKRAVGRYGQKRRRWWQCDFLRPSPPLQAASRLGIKEQAITLQLTCFFSTDRSDDPSGLFPEPFSDSKRMQKLHETTTGRIDLIDPHMLERKGERVG